MELFELRGAQDIHHNCIVKAYPNGRIESLVSQYAIFRESGWQLADDRSPKHYDWRDRLYPDELEELEYAELERAAMRGDIGAADSSIARARRRARSAVRELAHANEFDMFVTFTLDSANVNRYDVAAVTKKLNVWLDNRVRRHGLRYVLVPELHKDGAVHFHGLVNSSALAPVDSGTLSGGGKPRRPRGAKHRAQLLAEGYHVVYNLPAWTLGFSTGIYLYGEYDAAVNYVTKYISKTDKKVGGRWYYSGGALKRPQVLYVDLDFDAFCAEHADGTWCSSDGLRFCSAVIDKGVIM